jgi:hypothetical protein
MPRQPQDLSRDELLAIVNAIRDAMYEDYDGPNPDKCVNGGDLVEAVGGLMANYDLVPATTEEIESFGDEHE